MPENPILGRPAIEDESPVIGDDRALLNALDTGRRVGASHVKTNILDKFRDDLNARVENAIEDVPDLDSQVRAIEDSDLDEQAKLQERLNLLKEAERQGILGASHVLLTAEQAVREAQSRRPRMAADFQREASLIVGENPIGTALDIQEQILRLEAAAAKDEYNDIVDFARDELKIPPHVSPTSREFVTRYFNEVERWDLRQRTAQFLEIKNNVDEINADVDANYYMNRIVGAGQLLDTVSVRFNDRISQLAKLSQDDRIRWASGEDIGLDFSTRDLAVEGEEIKASLRQFLASQSNPDAIERVNRVLSFVDSMIDNAIEAVDNPNQDLRNIESFTKLITNRITQTIPQSDRAQAALYNMYAPAITAFSRHPAGDVRMMNIIDGIDSMMQTYFSLAVNNGRPITSPAQMRNSTSPVVYGRILREGMEGTNQYTNTSENPEINTFLDQLQTYPQFVDPDLDEALLNNQDYRSAVLLESAKHAEYLNSLDNAPKELFNQMVDNFSSKEWLDNAMKATPEAQAAAARSLVDFHFEAYSGFQRELDQEMRTTMVRPTKRPGEPLQDPQPLVSFIEVDLSQVEEDGTVIFSIDPNIPVEPSVRRVKEVQVKEWADQITRYVRAHATMQALDARRTDRDFVLAFEVLLTGGLYGAPLPLAEFLSEAEFPWQRPFQN